MTRWNSRMRVAAVVLAALASLCVGADDKPQSYTNNFEQTPPGKPPEDMLILGGTFAVIADGANHCMELSPDPLDNDGFLFGSAGVVTGTTSARIFATSTGRRFPEFGVGANDAGGYKLIVIPAQGTIEIRQGEEAKASAPYKWESGTWTRLKLRIAKTTDGKFSIEGKAWPDGTAEPKESIVSVQSAEAPQPGRSSAWGMPYAGTPIRFDDLASEPEK